MCFSFCHKRKVLFHFHEDCSRIACPFTQPQGKCEECCHGANGRCSLTNAPQPESGGCCHWNVPLEQGVVRVEQVIVGHLILAVTEDWLVRWGIGAEEVETAVNPQSLPLPRTFGLGVSPAEKEVSDGGEVMVWEWVL